MNLLDLFSGIGGFSLGLERAGFRTVAFCEIDPWCRRVLAKHWPGVPIHDDITTLDAAALRRLGVGRIDAICGGFPCQDVSLAGKGAGLDGERSGLWRDYARIVGEVRPRFVIVENVGALRGRGLAAVLADLASFGYDAEWHAIPAAAVGAPHLRDRVWIVACLGNADRDDGRSGRQGRPDPATAREPVAERSLLADAPDAAGLVCGQAQAQPGEHRERWGQEADGRAAADAHELGRRRLDTAARDGSEPAGGADGHEQGAPRPESERLGARGRWQGQAVAEPERERRAQLRGLFGPLARALAAASTPWERTSEPPLCGLDDELSNRLARLRLKALGNAVVPLIPEIIGRALLETYQ